MAAAARLPREQIEQFERDGFLVLENELSSDMVARLRESVGRYAAEFDGSDLFVFSARDAKTQKKTPAEKLLDSADKIRCFVERDALAEDGTLTREPQLSINKIGHNLHELDDACREVSFSDRVATVCRSFGMRRPLVVQSMYIFKQPRIGDAVNAHQDGSFLYTRPQSVIGLWWALQDCTKANGCLWAIPGSHREPVRQWFRRKEEDSTEVGMTPEEVEPFDLEGGVPLEIPAGSLVLLHSNLVHWSGPNRTDDSRHAYSIHVVEGAPDVEYPKENWLQRPPETPFRAIYDDLSG